jgi:large subunit ribosomal protein L3
MKEILGKKVGVTRIFKPSGEVVPVTVIEAGPCPVVAVRSMAKNKYEAYQVTFGEMLKTAPEAKMKEKGFRERGSHVTKPMAGVFKKANLAPQRYLREIKYDEAPLEVGQSLKVDIFREGERVDVTGTSRGLGFAGSVKRHHFGGGPVTHGQSDRLRAPGSLGQSSFPSRVFKGLRMAGRMGRETVTVLNLEVVKIFADENLILVRGQVPGNKGTLVKIRSTNRVR